MRKRIVDILPPKKFEEKLEDIVDIEYKSDKKIGKKLQLPKLKLNNKALLIVLVLVGMPLAYFFIPQKAKIEIFPKAEILKFETNLTIDIGASQSDFTNKIIPGQFFEKEKTIVENFPATGEVMQNDKAKGIIRVYNEYSTAPQILVATTRFVSVDGKLFRSLERVTIPGGIYEDGKLVPGELDIEVVSDKPGPEYNIGPSTFSIPGFAGSARYTKFYGKSSQSMSGGFSEKAPQATNDDLKNAEKSLTNRTIEEAESLLRIELQSTELGFIEKSINTEIIDKSYIVKTGDQKGTFDFNIKAMAKTLAFKKEALLNFAKDFIFSEISSDKAIYEKSLEINYVVKDISLNSDKAVISLDISAKIYSDPGLANLKNALMDKSTLETKTFLEDRPDIERVNVGFSPFWTRKVPNNLDKIEFKLNLD